jgi:hypothetical protein
VRVHRERDKETSKLKGYDRALRLGFKEYRRHQNTTGLSYFSSGSVRSGDTSAAYRVRLDSYPALSIAIGSPGGKDHELTSLVLDGVVHH